MKEIIISYIANNNTLMTLGAWCTVIKNQIKGEGNE